jgi:glycosyltransferase involved in cell wall biosynthesis
MKILLVSNGFPPRQWAGTETYTASIAKELCRRGRQVQVLCGGDWDTGSSYWNGVTNEIVQDVPVRRINVNWIKAPDPQRYLYNNPVTEEYVAKFLRETRPDLVHITSCERLSASILHAVKAAGIPMVLSLTDFWFLCPRFTLLRSDGENCDGLTTGWECTRCLSSNAKIYRWPRRVLSEEKVSQLISVVSQYPILTRQRGLRGMIGDMDDRKIFLHKAFQLPEYRITASSFVRDVFEANGFQAPISVEPYGHDISWLNSYTGKTPSEAIRIGFIGQIVEFKGVHLLIEAARALHTRLGQHFSLSVYGNMKASTGYSGKLRSLAVDLPNIHFCGTYSHEQSGRVFADIDILVVPSLWYDFPLIIYEAFATETPVIATNLGGMAEAVTPERNGLLFERGNVDDLATQIERILTEPGLLKRLSKGVPPVKTIDNEVAGLEEIYSRLLA